jgi:hypothetical protein
VAENQVTLEPGAGNALISLRAKDKESGQPVFPEVGNYILYAHIRDVGGDETTNSARCFSSIFLMERDVTSLEEAAQLDFTVYPNPAGTTLKLRGPGEDPEALQIFDLHGRILMEFTRPDDTGYDIRALPSGTYILRIQGKDHSKTTLLIKN